MFFSSFFRSIQQKVSEVSFQSLLGLFLISTLIFSCWHLMNLFLVFSSQFLYAFEYQLAFFILLGGSSLTGFIYLFKGASMHREAVLVEPLSLANPRQIAVHFIQSVIKGYSSNSNKD